MGIAWGAPDAVAALLSFLPTVATDPGLRATQIRLP